MSLKVLVTAGGTQVPIDDVRYVGNFATGATGVAIAVTFAAQDERVFLLAHKEAIARLEIVARSHPGRGRITVIPYRTFEEYRDGLFDAIAREKPDVVLSAAAVSDWLPADARAGKIDSSSDELTLRFKRAPKLIAELRERCGDKATLVGFKLLSGAPRAELLAKARKQMADCRLDLVLANDLSQMKDGRHPAIFMTPEGGAIPVDADSSDELARQLVNFVKKRHRTHPVAMRHEGATAPIARDHDAYREADALLRFAKSAKAHSTTSGNMSTRASAVGDLLVTPSGVDKKSVVPEDMVYVQCDPTEPELAYYGPKRPSIDTFAQLEIYRNFPRIHSFLHVHSDAGIFLTDAVTGFPYPCGTREEADDVVATIRKATPDGGPFGVELIHHGFMIGLEKGGAERLYWEWHGMWPKLIGHLYDLGLAGKLAGELVPRPIYVSASVAGVHAIHPEEGWATCMLHPDFRGKGHGERLAVELDRLGMPMKADVASGFANWLCTHGWQPKENDGKVILLVPPSMRDDLRDAATVCMVEPATRRVLLGKRKTSSWLGLWACPGGGLQPDELHDPFIGAKRELQEETGIVLPSDAVPVMITHNVVGTNGGGSAYRVTAYVLFTDRIPDHAPSDEIDPQVHDIEVAIKTLPMGRGTNHLLRRVLAELDRRTATKTT